MENLFCHRGKRVKQRKELLSTVFFTVENAEGAENKIRKRDFAIYGKFPRVLKHTLR